jgi:hypothetical protein
MNIKNPTKYATSLKDDVAFISRKLRKLSYLIPDEANDLINTLTELENYTENICEVLISKV